MTKSSEVARVIELSKVHPSNRPHAKEVRANDLE